MNRYFNYIFGAVVCFLIIYCILLLLGGVDNIIAPKGIHYEFSFIEDGGKISSDSAILIPAVINEKGSLVFNESELSELAFDCISTDYLKKRCGHINVSYATTNFGTMILIRPNDTIDLEREGILLYLDKDDTSGKKITLSPVVSSSLFSSEVTVPVIIHHNITDITKTRLVLNLHTCGYNLNNPPICRGYSTIEEKSVSQKDLAYSPVILKEFGQFNELGQLLKYPISLVYRKIEGVRS